ncbi:lantibiotic dehydratase [Streptomyces sp. MA5143a]|uniref:lantibiotic dehydratase n=1 Tax=Streptomyces sp. MA5143a TaxID=2083010 RepID=UPI000D19C450|nr:lantibiotic dehydratase [Streptomyces sp. MA5143a]SPF04632.1 hypothetical protein SMA5143A_5432 [Streptomyces sp. MA5143a]
MSADNCVPTSWSLVPIALLRQAGFPISLLDPLAEPDWFPEALTVLDCHSRLRAAGRRLRKDLKTANATNRKAVGNAVGMLRPVPEADAREAVAALGGDSSALTEYQKTGEELRGLLEEFRASLSDRLDRGRSAVVKAFADQRLQDVLLLSNDAAAPQFLDWLLRYTGERGGRTRRMTDMLAMYLQRVATKNETHSHFGPLNVARVDHEPGTFSWSQGPAVSNRTYISHWAAERLAQVYSTDSRCRPLIRPRRRPLVFVRNGAVEVYSSGANAAPGEDWRFAFLGRYDVDAAEEWLLRHADGESPLPDLERRWPHETGSLEDLDTVLVRLEERGWIAARIEVPSGDPKPLVFLRDRLTEVGADDAVASIAAIEADLAAFRDARHPDRPDALRVLKERFETSAAASANRLSGSHYADRSILWEEAHGRLDGLRIGADLAEVLTTELAFTYELALAAPRLRFLRESEAVNIWFRGRFGDETSVSLTDYYRAFTEDRDQLAEACAAVDADVASLDAEVERLLIGDAAGAREVVVPEERVAELRRALPRTPAAFCNPDVLFAAESPEALAAGRFLSVVGECHAGRELLTHSSLSIQIAERAPSVTEEVHRRYASLLEDDEYLADVIRGHSDKTASQLPFPGPDVEVFGRSPKPRSEVIHPADLFVCLRDGRLELRSHGRPGRLRLLAPPAGGYSLVDDPLALFAFPRLRGGNGLRLAHLPHVPRIRHGRTVIQRETWRIDATGLRGWSPTGSPVKNDDTAEFLTAAKLRAMYGWPRRVFAKVPGEPKPIFVDWDAPLLVRQFFRLVRKAEGTVVISEMVPDADFGWLRVDGARHTSELRYAVFSPVPRKGI